MRDYKAIYVFNRTCEGCGKPMQLHWPANRRKTCPDSPECYKTWRNKLATAAYYRRVGKPPPPSKPPIELTEGQRGYIAGILDGEGWLGIQARKHNWKRAGHSHYHRPAVSIGQAKAKSAVIDYLADLLKQKDVHINKGKAITQLSFHSSCLKWLLPQILPHLVLKHRQAEILIEFMSRCIQQGRELTEKEWQQRETLRQEIRELNKKPGGGHWNGLHLT